ncbi:uncharacterized protein ASPGLDRAFT_207214 [Aspergillus glaucus CBS 516.65]|uniref:Uncharacterized protein n=1 Tax=Aspergillus glaucus CBS 516.65 TaxID=1160497 RepID=A0A1L9VZ54_ASPGL|nr:hypothetical protein ASPGLDRAFT_207214 [Aspergillus glaucus CBS 516.65]OJJ89159.1 hypothetical protein ASPGLDRAFT_207214 [Aspergillus glaucus CBS 516.65]
MRQYIALLWVQFKYKVEQKAVTNRVTSDRRKHRKFSSGRERLFFNDGFNKKKKRKKVPNAADPVRSHRLYLTCRPWRPCSWEERSEILASVGAMQSSREKEEDDTSGCTTSGLYLFTGSWVKVLQAIVSSMGYFWRWKNSIGLRFLLCIRPIEASDPSAFSCA